MAALCVVGLSSGCATLDTTLDPEGPENLIYSGTRQYLVDPSFSNSLADYFGFDEVGGVYMVVKTIVDLPLSFVADTLILPITIPVTLHREQSADAES